MFQSHQTLGGNASLLKQKASKYSVIGCCIAVIAIILATILSGFFTEGKVSIATFIRAQKTNVVLWFLDGMPFVFALWGQYVNAMMSFEASALILDQTHELRAHTEILEQKAAHEATHDPLTSLPNRILFTDRLQQAINVAKRDETFVIVMILDMDRFKEVNDTLGHHSGDRLLKLIATRLKGIIREADTLARIGGDEFGFVLCNVKRETDLNQIAQKIKKAFSNSFSLENLDIAVQVSVGASIFPKHGRDADTLIQRADVAMYVAKQDHLDFLEYTKKLTGNSQHRLTLMGELRQAINNDELRLHYQPQIKGDSDQLCSVEALVRWQHPVHGLMPPNEFIPLAERTGLIKELTTWVMQEAMQQCSQWHRDNFLVGVAINISPHSLLEPEFPERLTGLLAAYDFPAESLILEITETSIMADPERAMAILNRLTEMGVKLSIDDFGTGYSSLSYLKELPVTELKIDKSFVIDMLESESDSAIVKATIQLGHNLGLEVVAEGVENPKVYSQLKELGCDTLQGYFISKPVPSDILYNWQKEHNANSNYSAKSN